jgi:hypothetical protein
MPFIVMTKTGDPTGLSSVTLFFSRYPGLRNILVREVSQSCRLLHYATCVVLFERQVLLARWADLVALSTFLALWCIPFLNTS